MSDPNILLTLAATGTFALAIAASAGLRGWQEWLELRRAQLSEPGAKRSSAPPELIDLRARVRRLEAIANGQN
jgi:hypothetical protein